MQPADLDQVVSVTGSAMRLGDVPYPLSVIFGRGHDPAWKAEGRKVQPGDWLYSPEQCLKGDEPLANTWNDDGTILSCDGCGLDVT